MDESKTAASTPVWSASARDVCIEDPTAAIIHQPVLESSAGALMPSKPQFCSMFSSKFEGVFDVLHHADLVDRAHAVLAEHAAPVLA